MRRAHHLILLVLMALCLTVWAGVAIFLLKQSSSQAATVPTLMALPTLTPSVTWTASPSATFTTTSTSTSTPTATASATVTPTLATRVIEIRAIMPGVYLPPTLTSFPPGTILLPAPPAPVEPLPDATKEPPPYMGWYSFESDHPNVHYSGVKWTPRQVVQASRGQYHRMDSTLGVATFIFEGEGLRVRYVAARNMGLFNVVVDGVVQDTVDAYATEIAFPGTQVYFVGEGIHTLEIRSAQSKNSQSEGYVVGLDAIQVFRGSANTLIIPPPKETYTPTLLPKPAAGIELVGAPPTVKPTATPASPSLVTISVVIAYDENGNRSVEPAEGVRGIPVRVVEIGSNQVVTQAFTDGSGYAQLQVLTASQARVVVPYFGKFWDIPRGRASGSVRFTLLLAPGTQPGLIP